MKAVGNILSLYRSITEEKNPQKEVRLLLDKKGIQGDKHYNSNLQRSVLIASKESYILAQKHQIEVPYGLLGENILVDYNPYTLAIGRQLQIGDTLLEISQPCPLCTHLTHIDHKLPKLLKDDRGIFARVIKAGKIEIGDRIYLLSEK